MTTFPIHQKNIIFLSYLRELTSKKLPDIIFLKVGSLEILNSLCLVELVLSNILI